MKGFVLMETSWPGKRISSLQADRIIPLSVLSDIQKFDDKYLVPYSKLFPESDGLHIDLNRNIQVTVKISKDGIVVSAIKSDDSPESTQLVFGFLDDD